MGHLLLAIWMFILTGFLADHFQNHCGTLTTHAEFPEGTLTFTVAHYDH